MTSPLQGQNHEREEKKKQSRQHQRVSSPRPPVPGSRAGVQRGQRAPDLANCPPLPRFDLGTVLRLQSPPCRAFPAPSPPQGLQLPERPGQGQRSLDFATLLQPRLQGGEAASQGPGQRWALELSLGLVPTSRLQMALAGDAVLELLWGWLFLPSWPPGFHPWQHEPLGSSSLPSSHPVLSA